MSSPDRFLVALIEHLPPAGNGVTMSDEEIGKFIAAMDAAVRLIYYRPEDDETMQETK